MKVVNLTKCLAYAFLGTLLLLIIIVLLVLSPLGVSTLVSIANDQSGVIIEDSSGSFYSEVSLSKVRFSNPQIMIKGDVVKLDMGLNCLFAGKACIDNISARNLEVVLLEDTSPPAVSESTAQYIELPFAAYLNRFALDQLSIYTQKTDAQKSLLAKLLKVNAKASMHKALVVDELNVKDATIVMASPSAPEEKTNAEPISNTGEHWIELLKNAQYTPIALRNVFVPINARVEQIAIAKLCLLQGEAFCTEQTQINGNINAQKLTANIVTNPQNQIASSISLKAKVDFADGFSHDINLVLLPNAKVSSKKAESVVINLVGKINDISLTMNSAKAKNRLLTLSAQFDVSKPALPLNIELAVNNYQTTLSAWLPELNIPISRLTASIAGNTQAYELNAAANIDTEQVSEISLAGTVSLSDKFFTISEFKTSGNLGNLKASLQAKLTKFAGTDGVSLTSAIGFNKLQIKPLVPQIDSQLNGNLSVNASITPTQFWGELNCRKVQGLLQGLNLSLLCDVSVNKAGLVNVKSFTLIQGKNRVQGNGHFELPSGLHTSDLNSSS
ncbi:MAG: autotransporter translocation and assembly factor TamB, partial [Glaciecola sp.]